MARISPKVEIINHFDNLINRIDIDIDFSLEKFNDELLKDLQHNSLYDRITVKKDSQIAVKMYKKVKLYQHEMNQTRHIFPESTKVIEYLKQIRMTAIVELKKEQEETLKKYKLNSSHFKSELNGLKGIEEVRREIFDDKFYFQIQIKQSIWAFNVFTIVTDFFMSRTDIESLE